MTDHAVPRTVRAQHRLNVGGFGGNFVAVLRVIEGINQGAARSAQSSTTNTDPA